MIKTINIPHVCTLALAVALSGCSLSKPGDKERSSMLNGDSSFQTISIKKKDPNKKTTSSTGNDAADEEALASASFSSGESVALGTFVSKVAEECGDNPFLKKIANVSGELTLNLDPVRTLLDEKQKDKKESEKHSFEVLAEAIFGEALGKEILAGKSDPIVQWVNYCQKTEDDPTIHGWITGNTLTAQKTAYVPDIKSLFEPTQAFSLAWAQEHLLNTILNIKPAFANDIDVDLSNMQVAVYPLINSKIENSQVYANYETIAAGSKLPSILNNKYGLYASAVADGINGDNTPDNEKLIFPSEQYIIPPGQKAQMKGTHTLVFSNASTGSSENSIKVTVLNPDGSPDIHNLYTWIQGHLDKMEGLDPSKRAVLLNKGGEVVVPSASDISTLAENAPEATTKTTADTTTPEITKDGSSTEPNPDKASSSLEKTPPQNTASTEQTFYPLPPWSQSGGAPESTAPVLVSKPKATADPALNPFEGTDFTCPEDYNLISLNIGCTDCLGPDMVGFEWSPEQLKASGETLEEQKNYKMLDDIFGPNTAKTLLSSKGGAQHTLNVCFNDKEYMGSFDDRNFKVSDENKHLFFRRNEFQPIMTYKDSRGQSYLNIKVNYRAFYTAFPDAVNDLKTLTKEHLLGQLDQHTLFYQPNADNSMYIISANPDLAEQIPIGSPDEEKYARAQKNLQFLIPLNDIANLHQEVDTPVTVKIGAKNISTSSYQKYASLLLDQFSSLEYLIAGDMPVSSIRYGHHDPAIYKALGAKIIASVGPNLNSQRVEDQFDLANFEANMRQGSSEVSTEHPGEYFKQAPTIDSEVLAEKRKANPLFGTTVISNSEMIQQCNNYAHRFGVSLKGKYTLLNNFETTEKKLTDLSETVPSLKELLNVLVLDPIREIAKNTRSATWNVYICSNTLETGILAKDAYIAFLDTMPSAPENIAGVFKISNPHSNIVIESNDKKNALLVGLDIVSFDVHDGDRVGEYMNLPSLVVSSIKKKQATRINFQFTGEFQLSNKDIIKSSKPIGSRFHFADTVRRLNFEPSLDPITNTFEVNTKVRNLEPEVVINDPIILYKNSLVIPEDQRNRDFPGNIDPSKPFDGYLQTFGELNAFQFGFWLEG